MTLIDAEGRARITTDTGSTLFVEAGAGSGKTSSLVDRIGHLVLQNGVPLRRIAAVTFTEKAGAELRERLRAAFEQRESAGGATGDAAGRALDDLDGAAIGTLHSFAQRILGEHPIEAGIPPLIEVLDEVGSSVAFDERWTAMLADLLDDDAMEQPLLIGLALGIDLKDIRSLALLLGRDWDLIEERVLAGEGPPLAFQDLEAFADRARIVAALSEECSDESDNLLVHFRRLTDALDRFDTAPNDQSRLAELQVIARLTFSSGRKGSWKDKDAAVQAGKNLAADAGARIAAIVNACLRRLARWVGGEVLKAANERRAEGRLEFHDLLVLSRELLRRDARVREALHDRYERLLLDEFQDTDPIQIDLAVRIAGGAAADATEWEDVVVPPGRLFVVGDPKQSIYRFRRASIATYLTAQQHLGETVQLTTNFRTVEPILQWIDRVFSRLIVAEPLAQPAFVALDPHRGAHPDSGPELTLLGARAHEDLPNAAADPLRELEAKDVADTVQRILGERWQVLDERTKEWRDAERKDIVILVPARTSLPFLQDAFESADVPYRAEASSLVYQAQEVRDLLAGARAVADPSDAFALVTVLRSPLFGCGDDDLWRFKQAKGSFNLFARLTEEQEALKVGVAISQLRRLANESRWMSPSEVLGELVAGRRMFEAYASDGRARDVWRRLRFVIDQARAWSEVSHGGLRAYLAWVALQGDETARVAEAVLPETDSDSVRVMTVHAAKGLEFPIVVMSGMSSQPQTRKGVSLLWKDGGYDVRMRGVVQTDEFVNTAPLDEQMGRLERIRLLYVAATRARDHLVVSLHRTPKQTDTSAALIARTLPVGFEEEIEPVDMPAVAVSEPSPPTPPMDYDDWRRLVHDAQAAAKAKPALSASGLEGTEPELVLVEVSEEQQGRAKGQRDLELPPWSKGRYGSAIGRAVHGVLQVVDLRAGSETAEFAAAVQAQAVAEGVTEQLETVHALASSALASELVQHAAAREHWRESYVGTVQDGTIVEGFIDLLYREDDGSLVVVDYKTDAVRAAGIPSRVVYYRPQIEAYLRGVRDANDVPVSGRLLFLHPAGAIEERVS